MAEERNLVVDMKAYEEEKAKAQVWFQITSKDHCDGDIFKHIFKSFSITASFSLLFCSPDDYTHHQT